MHLRGHVYRLDIAIDPKLIIYTTHNRFNCVDR